jgi:hypothetical protein
MKQEKLGRRVGNKIITTLFKEADWKPFQPLILNHPPQKAIRHPDGRVLIYQEGMDLYTGEMKRSGFLIDADKVDRYVQLVQEANEAFEQDILKYGPGPSHVLVGLLTQGKAFAEEIPQLVQQLSHLLTMPLEELDYSEDSVRRVENKLRRMGRKTWLEPALFSSVLAYMTEMLRRSVPAGQIRMRLHDDGKTWEPWVVDGEGRVAQVFLMIYDAMVEGPFTIQWHGIEGHLRRHPPNGFWENDST